MDRGSGPPIDRRAFLRAGSALAAGALLPGLAACDGVQPAHNAAAQPFPSRRAPRGPARELDIVAERTRLEIGPHGVFERWTYGGRDPGPQVRVREGERLRARLINRLPAATTIHWHGVPVPNEADGVPGVTQEAVLPGGEYVYDFNAEPSGSYIYHTHVGLQLDRGLSAPLVVEEATTHIEYDRDHVVMLDDLLPGAPEMPEAGRMGRGMMRGGMMRDDHTPEYVAFLMNGRPPEDPDVLEVRRGERVRLRLMNPAASTTFRVALAGHRMRVTHADGRPVRPVEVDSLVIGMGERYDVVVDADYPGVWRLSAASLDGGPAPARALLRYAGADSSTPSGPPDGLTGGRVLRLSDLASVATTGEPARAPDRTLLLTLRRTGMMRGEWTIDGQRWPDADPLGISPGERVRVEMLNHSPHAHPMHLHGFFFRVGEALKETVMVPGHMGRVAFEFTADEPGDWFFHCHHLYHMESGMARVFSYAQARSRSAAP